ncbi:hypothetical protein A2U01_0034326 [Trifolium medium]|uniref:Uncharacterized protein n=1 Tax=Trifolium medium TaxID=97028 RepID=A0A392PP39_9FABA|nr:hypothetical protein [Trifolium medium]
MSFPAKISPGKMIGGGVGAAATANSHWNLFFSSRRSQRWLSLKREKNTFEVEESRRNLEIHGGPDEHEEQVED